MYVYVERETKIKKLQLFNRIKYNKLGIYKKVIYMFICLYVYMPL